MTVYVVDPLRDPRWTDFLRSHPAATVFHVPGWLRALHQTYGYEPVVFTTSPPGKELANGWAFCRIRSWLTGRRLVSLPFSDHCEPLVHNSEELSALSLFLQRNRKLERWKYVEIRSANSALPLDGGFHEAKTFYLHRLDLRPSLDALL